MNNYPNNRIDWKRRLKYVLETMSWASLIVNYIMASGGRKQLCFVTTL